MTAKVKAESEVEGLSIMDAKRLGHRRVCFHSKPFPSTASNDWTTLYLLRVMQVGSLT